MAGRRKRGISCALMAVDSATSGENYSNTKPQLFTALTMSHGVLLYPSALFRPRACHTSGRNS